MSAGHHHSPERCCSPYSRYVPKEQHVHLKHSHLLMNQDQPRRHFLQLGQQHSSHRFDSLSGGQRPMYHLRTPKIPDFIHPNLRVLQVKNLSLLNLPRALAKERLNFKSWVVHQTLEETLLIACSCSKARYASTDTIAALKQQFGPPSSKSAS